MHRPLLEPWRRETPREPVLPHPDPDLPQRQPAASSSSSSTAVAGVGAGAAAGARMHSVVGLAVVANPHRWVKEHAAGARGRVVGVDEAALGPLEVRGREAVGDAAEFETLDACEG